MNVESALSYTGSGSRSDLRRKNLSQMYVTEKGKLNYISKTYESLDYDPIENELMIREETEKGYKAILHANVFKWVVFFCIGMLTASVASCTDIAIDLLLQSKNKYLSEMIEEHKADSYYVYIAWAVANAIPIFVGLMLVTYLEPMAAGSGIPLVKCYLNGVDIPRIFDFKTLCVKAIGLVMSIVAGVASGKEGPMIHIGGCVAALVSRGAIICGDKAIHFFKFFRDDTEKRDMVSAGAASGVSAAFGASVGGVLFSLEEGASFWNQELTWKIFFASVVSKFTLNVVLSWYYGHPGELTHSSLVNLGKCDFLYQIYEIPIFMLLGVIGGLMGALWNYTNYHLMVFRIRFLVRRRYLRIFEGILVAVLTSTTATTMMYHLQQCGEVNKKTLYKTQIMCEKTKNYNIMASLWLQTPQASVNSLLHDPPAAFSSSALITFSAAYFILSSLTFGLSSSNGIFVPSLLTGAAWGRFLCRVVMTWFPTLEFLEPGKYALIGAAAHLGGMVRMTISLTVIIMETSDNISFSLPIICTLMTAKWTGDFFNDGVYDTQIKLKSTPFLGWEPPVLTHNVSAKEIMNSPVECINPIESVGFVMNLLNNVSFMGFPVVESYNRQEVPRSGKLKGLMLRSQLLVMLHEKMFYETKRIWMMHEDVDVFKNAYVLRDSLRDIHLTPMELEYHLDVRSYMNHAPYTLLECASLPRVFRLFRAIGLRHLPIVDESNEVTGMITRKDIAKFKAIVHRGKVQMRSYRII